MARINMNDRLALDMISITFAPGEWFMPGILENDRVARLRHQFRHFPERCRRLAEAGHLEVRHAYPDARVQYRCDLQFRRVGGVDYTTPTCPVCGKAIRFEWVNRGNAAEPDPDLIAVCDCGWSELEPPAEPHPHTVIDLGNAAHYRSLAETSNDQVNIERFTELAEFYERRAAEREAAAKAAGDEVPF